MLKRVGLPASGPSQADMALAYSKAYLLKQLRIGTTQPEEPEPVSAQHINSFLNYAASTATDTDANSVATSHSDSSVSPTSTPRLSNQVSFEIGTPEDDSSLTEGALGSSSITPSAQIHTGTTDDDATPQALHYLSDDCSDFEERMLMGIIGSSMPSNHSYEGPVAEPEVKMEFGKRDVPEQLQPAVRSFLSSAISISANDNDPLSQFVGLASGTSGGNSLQIKCYFHFGAGPKSLNLKVRPDAQVHCVIGYALHSYSKSATLEVADPNRYNVRLVEDDGEPDDDFPALERKRQIHGYSLDEIVLVLASEDEYESNKQLTPFSYSKKKASISQGSESVQITVRAYTFPFDHILSNVYWTDQLAGATPTLNVLTAICKEKNLEQADYVMRVVGSRAPASTTSTLSQLKPQPLSFELQSDGDEPELVLLLELVPRRAIREDESMRSPQKRGRQAESVKSMTSSTDGASSVLPGIPALTFQKFGYYKYKVWRRQHVAFLGRQERELAIDGEYVYIMPPSERSVLEQPKTTTFHIRQVVRCKRSSKNNLYCKIFVMKQTGPKRYDIDCVSASDCTEIVERINRLMRSQ